MLPIQERLAREQVSEATALFYLKYCALKGTSRLRKRMSISRQPYSGLPRTSDQPALLREWM